MRWRGRGEKRGRDERSVAGGGERGLQNNKGKSAADYDNDAFVVKRVLVIRFGLAARERGTRRQGLVAQRAVRVGCVYAPVGGGVLVIPCSAWGFSGDGCVILGEEVKGAYCGENPCDE